MYTREWMLLIINSMNTLLYKTIEALDLNTLSEERKNILDLLVVFIQEKKTAQA
ncbi:MAG TPA: protein-tyrosine-phosphatase, partial [Flavobacteriaceae bacterium]|nr:protein-tyrosine-phosphatase [Flavobacteriaceae bacterium]